MGSWASAGTGPSKTKGTLAHIPLFTPLYSRTHGWKARTAASRWRLAKTLSAETVQSVVLSKGTGIPRLSTHVVAIPIATNCGIPHIIVSRIAVVACSVILGGVEARRQVAICLGLKLLPRVLAVQRALPLRGRRAVGWVVIVRHVVKVVLHVGADMGVNFEAVTGRRQSSRRHTLLEYYKR